GESKDRPARLTNTRRRRKRNPPRRPGLRQRRRNRRKRRTPPRRNAAARQLASPSRSSVSTRRSRGHVKEGKDRASCVVRRTRLGCTFLFRSAHSAWGSAERDRGAVAALCLGLESGRSRGVHERLRAGLAHQLYGERARAVRLAGAVRSLSEELLRPREVTRLALVRRAARARAHARLRVCDGTIQTDARGFGRGERTIHAGAPETGRPLADPARSYIGRPQVNVTRRHPSLRSGQAVGRMLLCLVLPLIACSKLLPPKEHV